MKLTQDEVLALQAVARGPVGVQGSLLEEAAQHLETMIPGAELVVLAIPDSESANPGDPVDLSQSSPAVQHAYLATELEAGKTHALLLLRNAGRDPLSARDRALLQLAAQWLPRWLSQSQVNQGSARLKPVGSAVWINRTGRIVQEDEEAMRLLTPVVELKSKLAEVFSERSDPTGNKRAERVVHSPGRGYLRLRAEIFSASSKTCLVTVELLKPGSAAMFQAQTRVLNSREAQIARLALEGWGNKGIGQQLSLSAATINMYLGQIYSKLGVKNRAQLTKLLTGAGGA